MSLKSVLHFFCFLIFYKSSFNSVQNGANGMLIFQAVTKIQPFKCDMYPKLKLRENAKIRMCCSTHVYSLATISYIQDTNMKFGTLEETR